MKYAEAEKILKHHGCYLKRTGKRRPIWHSNLTGLDFAMSYHNSEEIKSGTKKAIEKLSGVKL
jgi:hypothetical protein